LSTHIDIKKNIYAGVILECFVVAAFILLMIYVAISSSNFREEKEEKKNI
jgi:hypothetical protein